MTQHQKKEQNKKNINSTDAYFLLFLIFLALVIGILLMVSPQPKGYVIQPVFKPKVVVTNQDFPEFNFTPQINIVIEALLDIIWDVDQSSGFDGILPLAFSYVPFLGSNGTVFTDIIFILSVTVGLIVLTKRLRG